MSLPVLALNPISLLSAREIWVLSLGREDALEEGIAIIPVFLPGESPGTEEPG